MNIPFADALEKIPYYAKFMKEIRSKKKKIKEQGTINLSEQCSAIIERPLLEKLKTQVVSLFHAQLVAKHLRRRYAIFEPVLISCLHPF